MDNKVPIPRVVVPVGQDRNIRTSKACGPCRQQKCKCSGDQPVCQQCDSAGLRCFYRETKRQKMDRERHQLAYKLHSCCLFLREIQPQLDPDSARRAEEIVINVITEIEEDPVDDLSTPTLKRSGASGQDFVNSEKDSQELVVDFTEEDFNRDIKSQATGFLGEHSEISWLYRLRRELEQDQQSTVSRLDSNLQGQRTYQGSITSMNYSIDETDLRIDMGVDVFHVPPWKIADDLINSYLHIVHPSFPIISKTLFTSQFRSFYSKASTRPGKRWLAILNLIFATAARYKRIACEDNLEKDYNDLEYFARAWKLSMANFALAVHPDLQQVQVESLASFYLLSIGQVNRSWRICGLAIRSAITMGIHLRSESPDISPVSRENRCWVWWSLYTLDITLCLKTGRGPSVSNEFTTTPLPLPFEDEAVWKKSGSALIRDYRGLGQLISSYTPVFQGEHLAQHVTTPSATSEQEDLRRKRGSIQSVDGIRELSSNTSVYFLSFVELTLLMRQSIESLYAPAFAKKPWLEREDVTISLNTRLDEWLSQLSPELRFKDTEISNFFIRQRVSLAFRFYSTKLLLLQPCLRRASKHLRNESCERLAGLCVESAFQMLLLFPEYPDASWLYNISPWWCTLHYLMQSMVVFLTELCNSKRKGSNMPEKLAASIRKSVRWLRDMSTRDPPSDRAWQICKEIITIHFPAFSSEANCTD